jgi:putative endonuclease
MTYYKKKTLGNLGEFLTIQVLKSQGLHLVHQNYKTKYGEIDLIVKNKSNLFFVESKLTTGQSIESAYLKWKHYQSPRLYKSAQIYCRHKQVSSNLQVQFLFVHFDFSHKEKVEVNLFQPHLTRAYSKKAI